MDIQSFDFNDLAKDTSQAFGEQKSSNGVDDRFYKLKRDDKGNGAAVIRFLPDPDMKLMQQIFRINVNNQKGADRRWVSELSPQNVNLPDPFHKRWADLWQAGQKDEARKFSRQTRYFTNILVIKDPAAPENEGKIFLMDLSQSLKTILEGVMFPSEADKALGVEPKQLFNPLNGNNFKLVSRKGANGFINYDASSVVSEESAAFESKEEAIKTIKEKCYALSEFLDPKIYKSYEELEEKLRYVTFQDGSETTTAPAKNNNSEVVDSSQALTHEEAASQAASMSDPTDDLDSYLDSI